MKNKFVLGIYGVLMLWACYMFISLSSVEASEIMVSLNHDNNSLQVIVGNNTNTYDTTQDFNAEISSNVECQDVTMEVQACNETYMETTINKIMSEKNMDEQAWFTETLVPKQTELDTFKAQATFWETRYNNEFIPYQKVCEYVNATAIEDKEAYKKNSNMQNWLIVIMIVLWLMTLLFFIGSGRGWIKDLKDKVTG